MRKIGDSDISTEQRGQKDAKQTIIVPIFEKFLQNQQWITKKYKGPCF